MVNVLGASGGKRNPGFVFIGMGFELVAIILGAIWLGEKIDETYQTQGLAVVTLIFVLFSGWFVHLILLLRRYMKETEGNNKDLKP